MTELPSTIKTSYVFPLAIYYPKILQTQALGSNSSQQKNTNNVQKSFGSMKNVGDLATNNQKTDQKKFKLPSVKQSKYEIVVPTLKKKNTSKLIRSHKDVQTKTLSNGIYVAFKCQERQQSSDSQQQNHTKSKNFFVPNDKFENLKVITSSSENNGQFKKQAPFLAPNKGQKDEGYFSLQQASKIDILRHKQVKRTLLVNKSNDKFKQEENKKKQLKHKLSCDAFSKKEQLNCEPSSCQALLSYQYLKKSSTLNYDLLLQELNIVNGVFFQPYQKKILVFIGKGNNRQLIEQLLKRRQHFQLTKNLKQANIIWQQKQQKDCFHSADFLSTKKINYRQCVRQKLIPKFVIFEESILPKLFQKSNLFQAQDVRKIANFYTRSQNLVFQTKILAPVVQNHLPGHRQISDKKNLYLNLKKYCKQRNMEMVDFLPRTFLIKKEFRQLQTYLQENQQKNLWIVKPSENSNQGKGIKIVISQDQLYNTIYTSELANQSLIVQEYLSKCLLYHNRKFDIRTYMLVTNHGSVKCYWYNDGYIRTSSHKYDNSSRSQIVHLTNDAIQCKYPDYGKYQECNKISYNCLQRYLNTNFSSHPNIMDMILSQMKSIAQTILQATVSKMVESSLFNYQIFGLDFMIDSNFKVYLIQANTNPSIETHCPLLQRVIPSMLQQAFRIAVDPLFKSSNNLDQNRFYEKGKFELLPISYQM